MQQDKKTKNIYKTEKDEGKSKLFSDKNIAQVETPRKFVEKY